MDKRGLEPTKRVAYFEYDFAKDGGAVGDIALRGDGIPIDAIITDGKIHTKTALTSGGSATVALTLLSAGDIKAATAISSFTLNSIQDVVPVRTAASSIRNTTQGQKLTATVAVAALTAGKFIVALEYY
jgi:hypothetical protein